MLRIVLEIHGGDTGIMIDWKEFTATEDVTELERVLGSWVKTRISDGISATLKGVDHVHLGSESDSQELKAAITAAVKGSRSKAKK